MKSTAVSVMFRKKSNRIVLVLKLSNFFFITVSLIVQNDKLFVLYIIKSRK